MALNLTKELPSGSTGCYWKIEQITLNSELVRIDLFLYKDEAARREGKQPMERTSIVLGGDACTDAAMDSQNPKRILYPLIKASRLDGEGNETNPFVAATDC